MNPQISSIICLISIIIIGYLLGSVNFAIIMTKLFAHDDIRKHGSGNAGLTNVLRTVGKGPASLTLLGDFAKGFLSVLAARLICYLFFHETDSSQVFLIADYFAIYGAVLGHVFPLYYHFRGGKGILVTFGGIMLLSPIAGIICLTGFLLCVIFTHYVSLGSVVAAIIFPLSIMFMSFINYGHITLEFLFTIPVSLIVLYMHRENIKRLLMHTENKISFKKKEK